MRAERDALLPGLERAVGHALARGLDAKRRGEERQIGELPLDCPSELRGCCRPRGGEAERGRPVGAERHAGSFLRLTECSFEVGQLVPFPANSRAVRDDLLEGRPVFPLQLREDVEPLDDGREPCRIGLEPLEVARGRRRDVGHAFDQLVDDRETSRGIGVDLGEGRQGTPEHCQDRQGASLVRLECRHGVRQEPATLLDARERHLLLSERLLLANDRRGTVDLADPELQDLEAGRTVLPQSGDPLAVRVFLLPRGVEPPDLLRLPRKPGEPVEQVSRRRGVEELARLGLTVEDEEPRSQLRERSERGWRAVDEEAPLPTGGDLTPHDDLGGAAGSRLAKACSGESAHDRRVVRLERSLDDEALGAPSDEGRVGTLTREERERVHDEGLPRAGLARQDSQAGVERDLDVLENGEVTDAESAEHGPTGRRGPSASGASSRGRWPSRRSRSRRARARSTPSVRCQRAPTEPSDRQTPSGRSRH